MFAFVVKNLAFLKAVPLLPLVFDSLLRLRVFFIKPEILDWLDELEAEASTWPGMSMAVHKYGGLQFNYRGKEIAHLHSNGLLDSRKTKTKLILEGRIQEHHVFAKSGWISFYLRSKDGLDYAKKLLLAAYLKKHQGNLKAEF